MRGSVAGSVNCINQTRTEMEKGNALLVLVITQRSFGGRIFLFVVEPFWCILISMILVALPLEKRFNFLGPKCFVFILS